MGMSAASPGWSGDPAVIIESSATGVGACDPAI